MKTKVESDRKGTTINVDTKEIKKQEKMENKVIIPKYTIMKGRKKMSSTID